MSTSDRSPAGKTRRNAISHNAVRQLILWYSSPARKRVPGRQTIMATTRNWFIRNIAAVPWRQFPDHFGGALFEAAGYAGNRGLKAHRLPNFDVPADGLCEGAPTQGAGAGLSRDRRRRPDAHRRRGPRRAQARLYFPSAWRRPLDFEHRP